MPGPRRRPKKPLIDFSGTRKTIDILRDANAGLNRMRDRIDEEEDSAAHDAEVRRCRYDAIILPHYDPKRTAAHERMLFITGRPYGVWRKLKLIARGLWRRVRDELLLALWIPLQLLLIVVCNVAGFLLLWWLLFGF